MHHPAKPKLESENLGEFLAGDHIHPSPYRLYMKKDMYCEQVCINNLGRGELTGHAARTTQANKVVRAIRKDYHHNWIVDNLPSATKLEDEARISTSYHQGFPMGFIADHDGRAYIHNHVNLEIEYHKAPSGGGDRIVRFTVEPFSVKHDFEPLDPDEAAKDMTEDGSYLPKKAKIINPIASCNPQKKANGDLVQEHTTYDMITADKREPQEASGKVLFTYDVIWTENKEITWAHRWDIYLTMQKSFPTRFRWLSIVKKMIVVVVLSTMVAAILVRNLRRDISRYNRVSTDEERAEELEEYGWKLVHADVFRPPSFSAMFYSICMGTGAQLLATILVTIFLLALGFMNPARRGRLVMGQLLVFVVMGAVGGYVNARLYKTFKGKRWQLATMFQALGFPGVAFGTFFIMNMVALTQNSTDAVPFVTILILMILWIGVSTPLVFFGSFLAYRQDAIEFPVNTSSLPRQIPDQPWFLWAPCTAFITGILPYGSCVYELQLILGAMWEDITFNLWGFLLVVFFVLLITCAMITILFTYFQLCSEDYHWWWRSFVNGGAAAVWVFLYSITYFRQLESNASLATYFLYFGYMGLVCSGLFTVMGFVGVSASLWFNKTVYASIKID